MTWWNLTPGFAVAAFILFLPGLIVSACWRLKPLAAFSLSPLLSFTAIGISTIPATLFNKAWGPWWVFGCAVVLALPGLFRWRRPQTSADESDKKSDKKQVVRILLYLCGIIIAAGFIGRRIMWAMDSPQSVAQNWDNSFHLNAAAYVLNTGHASAFDVGPLTGTAFYPATFHDTVALVASLARLDIIPAVHAVVLAVILLVWPVSLMFLLETFFDVKMYSAILLGVFALGLNSFPYVLIDWGLVYPNIVAVAVTPALMAVTMRALGRGNSRLLPWSVSAVLLAPVIVGTGLIHPNAVFLTFAVCLPALILDSVRLLTGRVPQLSRARAACAGAALALVAAAGCSVWVKQAASLTGAGWTDNWKPFETFPQAIGEALTGSSMGRASFPVSILALIGLFWLVINLRRNICWLSVLAVTLSFYIVAAASPNFAFRRYYTGVFYSDNYRMAAYLTMVVAPTGVMGVQWVAEGVAYRCRPLLDRLNEHVRPVVGVAGALLLTTLLTSLTISDMAFSDRLDGIRRDYLMHENADILSANEVTLMEQVDSVVGSDAKIIVNPWQGGNLVYLLAQREPSQFYMMATPSNDVDFINKHLNQVENSPQVCQALTRENAWYVLDLDKHWIAGSDTRPKVRSNYEGLENLESTPGLTPVLRVGDDTLYRITACG